MTFNEAQLPDSTLMALKTLSDTNGLDKMALIGGTALALQIGHRISEDIDLFFFDDIIDNNSVKNVIENLRKAYTVNLVPHDIMLLNEFDDAGFDLNTLHQNYSIITDQGPVKLSFSCSDKNKDTLAEGSFKQFGNLKVADEKTIFTLKSIVITRRHKKRDLFDLNEMMNRGIGDIGRLREVVSESHEHYIDVTLNKLLNWPASDLDDIHFKNKTMSDPVIEKRTIAGLSKHITQYDLKSAPAIKSAIETLHTELKESDNYETAVNQDAIDSLKKNVLEKHSSDLDKNSHLKPK